jgi:outer membrane immunogenic protein
MQRLLVTLALLIIGVGDPASAADLRARPVVKAPIQTAIPAVADWSGFYVGVHGGGSAADATYDFADPFPANHYNRVAGDRFTHGMSGALFGGHAGFNWQWSQIVLGVEASGGWANLSGTAISPFFPLTDTFHSRVKWISSLTARVGFAAGPALLYVKGGAAWAGIDTRLQDTGDFNQRSGTASGWTAGAGIEYLLMRSVVLGVEADYYDFGVCCGGRSESLSLFGGAPIGQFSTHDTSVTAWSVLGRLSYKFGSPVVASY